MFTVRWYKSRGRRFCLKPKLSSEEVLKYRVMQPYFCRHPAWSANYFKYSRNITLHVWKFILTGNLNPKRGFKPEKSSSLPATGLLTVVIVALYFTVLVARVFSMQMNRWMFYQALMFFGCLRASRHSYDEWQIKPIQNNANPYIRMDWCVYLMLVYDNH